MTISLHSYLHKKRGGNSLLRLFLFIFLSFSLTLTWGQDMESTNQAPITPENLITNYFLGDGVQVLSLTHQGDPNAVAFFKNGLDEIGIDRGIVLATGNAHSPTVTGGVPTEGAAGGSNSNASTDLDDGPTGDPDLNAISTVPVRDVTIYTITFIPTSDTIRFNYVFASEEYPNYTCTSFNDVFGFFISGPGISGPYSNNGINMALIPGTDLPVAINTLNGGSPTGGGTVANCSPPNGSLDYSAYFINNQAGNNQPIYDGMTTVLTAQTVVIPCETYTIKLAIADGFDGILDSGVFLEAKSFGSGTLDVEAATVSLDGSVAEGCADGTLTISLPNPLTEDYVVDYNILGDAINGVDYETIPTDLIIPAGQTELIIPIVAIEDNITEGPESLIIDIKKNVCARDTIHMLIRDNPLIPIELRPDTTICPNDSLLLDGTVNVPLPDPLTFTNSTPLTIPDPDLATGDQNPVYSDIEVIGVLPATLNDEVITSVCINNLQHNWADDLDIFLISPGGQFVELSTDNGGSGNNYEQTCFTLDATTPINFPGPVAPNTAPPFTGNWLPEGTWSDLWDGEYPTNGTWQLLLIDDGQGFQGTLNEWSITFKPAYEIKYEWTPTTGVTCPTCPITMVNPDETTTYTVVATDSYGCTEASSVTVGVSPTPAHTPIVVQGVSCAGDANGQATVDITGGAGPFTFEWPDVMQSDSIAVNLGGGVHTVHFGDNSGCIYSTEVDIPAPDALESDIVGSDVSCHGEDSAEVTASATGGTGDYDYLWNNAATTATVSNLSAGTYTVTITDDNNCTITDTIQITEAPLLEVTALADSTNCADSIDGETTASATGGNGGFMFAWYDNTGTLVNQMATATGLSPGQYQCIVTDISGCKDTTNVTVASPDALVVASQETDVLCFGDTNGQSNVQVQGGTPGYTYAWSDLGTATPNRTDLAAGNHTLIITDDNGCEEIHNITIGSPDALASTSNKVDISCFGANDGQATVTPDGGIMPYEYVWDNTQTTPMATDLTPGIHTVTITDGNDCEHEINVTIDEPDELIITPTAIDLTCFQSQDGAINIQTQGGTSNYTYAWDSGQMTDNISGLTAGTYTLTTTDANNCQKETPVTITEPTEITSTSSSTLAGCNGANNGTATVTVQGGTPTYNYIWDNGETTATAGAINGGNHQVTVTDNNDCEHIVDVFVDSTPDIVLSSNQVDILCYGDESGSISVSAVGGVGSNYSYTWSTGATTPQLTNLSPGTYTLSVTDPLGCEAETSINITEAPQLSISSNIQDVACADEATGNITVSTTGGTPNYTYAWSNGNDQANNENLTQGDYTLTIVDANGCLHTREYEVTAPTAITIDLDPTHIDCYGDLEGELSSQVAGGIPPYNYSWSTGDNTNSPQQGLAAGTYTLSILDANGCIKESTQEITQPLAPVAATTAQEDVSCNEGHDGLILIEATGGTAPYQYSLDNTNFNGSPQQIGLEAGSYRVFIKDAKDCVFFIDDIIIEEPDAIDVDLGPNVELNYTESHVLTPTITSTNPIVTYEWTPNNPDLLDCFDCISPTVTTDHQVSIRLQVIDENGCKGEDYINIYVKKDFGIYVPTGFTPNNDGNNDILIVHGIPGAVINSFRIFDRWGELLHENNDFDVNLPTVGWDGSFRSEPMNSGTYIWHIEATLPDGNEVSLHGSTNLIR